MTPRRAQLKQENRDKLVSAARKVFAEKGLATATARDIVRETDRVGHLLQLLRRQGGRVPGRLRGVVQQARIAARGEAAPGGHQSRTAHLRLLPRVLRARRRRPADVRAAAPEADAIAMLGSETCSPPGREFIEDMEQWLVEGQLTIRDRAVVRTSRGARRRRSDSRPRWRTRAPRRGRHARASHRAMLDEGARQQRLASIGFTHSSSTKITIAARIGTETIRPTAPKSCPTTITPIAITAGCSFTVRGITTGSRCSSNCCTPM